MALKLKPMSQRPLTPELSSTTNQLLDWLVSATNQLIGISQQPSGQGFPALAVHTVDPTTSQLSSKGARTGSLATGCGFTCPSTTQINIYWDGTNSSSILKIYRDDATVAGPFPGHQFVTGLTANTTYFFYPYFDEIQQLVLFVSQPGAVGTPPIAYTSALIQNGIAQMYRGRTPLFSNLATTGVTTPAAGTTPATKVGGGGGGSGAYLGFKLT